MYRFLCQVLGGHNSVISVFARRGGEHAAQAQARRSVRRETGGRGEARHVGLVLIGSRKHASTTLAQPDLPVSQRENLLFNARVCYSC